MLTYKSYGTEYKIKLEINHYAENNNFALQAFSWEEDLKFWEPFAVFTKNLGVELPEDEACIDANNLPDLADWLVENKLAEPTGYAIPSGYCVYPVYKFDLNKINAIIAEQDKEE